MSIQAIDEGHRRFMDAMRHNDPDALMEVLADEVVFMPPNEEPRRGKAAVREWYAGVVAQATTAAVEVPERSVIVAGDFGIEQGHYVWTLAPTDGSEQFTTRGSFVAIWQRQADGSWRGVSDIWNSSEPAS